MADKTTQTFANHMRWHPPFHYFLAPGSLVLIVLTIVNVVRHYERLDSWTLLVMAVLFFVAVFLLRSNALRVQDRVIRLEERLRLQALCPGAVTARIGEFTESQLIALRFASDQELPGLAAKVLAGNPAAPKEIKKAIVTWRPDTFRV